MLRPCWSLFRFRKIDSSFQPPPGIGFTVALMSAPEVCAECQRIREEVSKLLVRYFQTDSHVARQATDDSVMTILEIARLHDEETGHNAVGKLLHEEL
jgi:hypothetical protein